jgi:hypothetical protein
MAPRTPQASAPLWPLPDATASAAIGRRHAAAQLALPCAAIGLVGGALTGSMANKDEITTAFALVTMLSAGILGAYLTHRRRIDGTLTTTRVFVGTFVAGIANGALLLVPFVFPVGSCAGAIAGALFSLPFFPALLMVARWGDAVGQAQTGSIVDAAHRRGPIAAAALSIAIAAALATFARWHDQGRPLLWICALAATGALVIVVALDALARAVARRAACTLHEGRPLHLELGVGDDVLVEGRPEGVPYRAAPSSIRVCGGDPATAHDRLRGPLLRHAIALAIVVLTLALHVSR